MSVTNLGNIQKTPRQSYRKNATDWINYSIKGDNFSYVERRKKYFAGVIPTSQNRKVYANESVDKRSVVFNAGRDILNLAGNACMIGAAAAGALTAAHIWPLHSVLRFAIPGAAAFAVAQGSKLYENIQDGRRAYKAENKLLPQNDPHGLNRYETFLKNYHGGNLKDVIENYKSLVTINRGEANFAPFHRVNAYKKDDYSNLYERDEENGGKIETRDLKNGDGKSFNKNTLKTAMEVAGMDWSDDHSQNTKTFLQAFGLPNLIENVNDGDADKKRIEETAKRLNITLTGAQNSENAKSVNKHIIALAIVKYENQYSEGGKTLQKIVEFAKKDADKIIAENLNNPLTPRQLFEKLKSTVYNKYAAHLLLAGNTEMARQFTKYCREHLTDYRGAYQNTVGAFKNFGSDLNLDIDDENH